MSQWLFELLETFTLVGCGDDGGRHCNADSECASGKCNKAGEFYCIGYHCGQCGHLTTKTSCEEECDNQCGPGVWTKLEEGCVRSHEGMF